MAEELDGQSKKTKRRERPVPGGAVSRFRGFWIGVAAIYLVTVWLDGVGSTFPAKLAPRPWIYFAQVAALFVTAAPKVIDYRAEGWSCRDHRWVEIDVRPYFQVNRENKENRFQRALQFYRKNRLVMRALEDFVVTRNNARGGAPIGGVRFSSLRLSYPGPGEHVTPYERLPLATYSGEQRHNWYWTPGPRRNDRCGQSAEPGDAPDEGAHDTKPDDPREGEP